MRERFFQGDLLKKIGSTANQLEMQKARESSQSRTPPAFDPTPDYSTHAERPADHSTYASENSTNALQHTSADNHMGKAPQAYGESPEAPQAYGERQAYGECLEDDVLDIAFKHALKETIVDYGKALFSLYRELEPTGRAWTENRWKVVVACWRTTSIKSGAELPGFTSVWAVFKKKQKILIKKPKGEMLKRVKARRPLVVMPADLIGTKYEPIMRTMIALHEEHGLEGRQDFSASFRVIAALSGGIDPKTAQSQLASLSNKGYISLLEAGVSWKVVKGQASKWRVHIPPIPGKATWNSNKKMAESQALPPTNQPGDIADPRDFY